ncbi:MAG: hypothetical protein U0163_19535 [Gemmatimonadaceae bacterium]
MSRSILATLLALFAVPVMCAQAPARAPTDPVRLRGEFGTTGEIYGISGRDARRPDQSGRIYFNPTVTLFGALNVSMNLLLSSEGAASATSAFPGRQKINQLGITPQWSWGRAHLGSFTDSYTPLTWSGIRVNGLGVEVQRSRVMLGLFGGSARDAAYGGAVNGSYARRIAGGRVGLGRPTDAETGSTSDHLTLMVLRAWDDPSTLRRGADSLFLPDSLSALPDTALLPRLDLNPNAVTPEENTVVGVAAGRRLFGGALLWSGEVDGSIHTRDRRAAELDPETLPSYPSVLRRFVTPRVGTHYDVAYQTDLQFRVARLPGSTRNAPRSLAASFGARQVGPGYVSLGTPWTPNDLRELSLRGVLQSRRWSVRLDGLSQRDNLLGQKLATTDRRRIASGVTWNPSRRWNTSFQATHATMNRDASDLSGAMAYSAWQFGASQAYSFDRSSRVRSVIVTYSLQDIGDAARHTQSSSLNSSGANVRVVINAASGVTISPVLGAVRTSVGPAPASTRSTYGASSQWRAREGRWTAGASLMRSQLSRSNAFTSTATAQYELTERDALALYVRTSKYRGLLDRLSDFDEHTVNIRWAHRL